MRRWLLFAAATLFVLPAIASPQHRGGMPGTGSMGTGGAHRFAVTPHAISNNAPHFAVRVPVRAGAPQQMRTGSGVRIRGTGRPVNHVNVVPFGPFGETDFQDVPGLGFDYPHLAAVSGNRHSRGARVGGVFPFGFDGFFLSTPSIIVEEAQAADAPQAADSATVDSTAGDSAYEADMARRARGRRNARQSYDSGAPSESVDSAPAPPENETEYVFVRRDGGLLFGVGYSWENSTLRYVTRDGLRRSIARDALDMSATEQFNEQRGLQFHAPA